ncbi:hypothetical protein B0H16DRAFT_1532953 [Mycena metata]|uniref:Uncharacterized protein n=1 Tax=Mycena metata TaxID=1033252 RepID=A0AAD7JBS8_9AGAR|nr:hypothetical protein B0H16DRAFT_1532953 [Mycena metata]
MVGQLGPVFCLYLACYLGFYSKKKRKLSPGGGLSAKYPSTPRFHLSMYRSRFGSIPSEMRSTTSLQDEHGEGILPGPVASLLPATSEGIEVPDRPRFRPSPSKALRLLSLILHVTMIVLHLVLLAVWSRRLEHRLIFQLEYQTTTKFFITAIATAFRTIYSALLVLVTQTLCMKRSLQMDRTLTAIHDNAAAWAGIGSAALQLWRQKAVPATTIGVLSTLLYLGNIMLLHITIPGLFSLETFNSSQSVPVVTQSLPAYNWTSDSDGIARQAPLAGYAQGSLYFLPSILGSTASIGLHGGTLYDVPGANRGTGAMFVNATGFNITCGLPTQVDVKFSWTPTESSANTSVWWLSLDGDNYTSHDYGIFTTQPGMISTALSAEGPSNAIVLYSTLPIIDTNQRNGFWVQLTPPMNNSLSSIQVLKCWQSLVPQTAVVDAQTGKFFSASPEIRKTTSTWSPYSGPGDIREPHSDKTKTGNLYIDAWATWYTTMPTNGAGVALNANPAQESDLASVADVFLMQNLNLRPSDYNGISSNPVALHDLENALSILVASMFWTLGHIPPTLGQTGVQSDGNGPWYTDVAGPFEPPFFLEGNATATETLVLARLNLSVIAVAARLAVSIALTVLSLAFSFSRKDATNQEVPTNGTGILHAIWLFRNNPELKTLLPQAENPTNENLRQMGMMGRMRLRKASF